MIQAGNDGSLPGHGQIEVAGRIDLDLQAEIARRPPHHLVRDFLARTERRARDAGRVRRALAQFVEEALGKPGIDADGRGHPPPPATAAAAIRGQTSGLTRCGGRRPASTSTI